MKKIVIIMILVILSACSVKNEKETLICNFDDLYLQYNDAKTHITYSAQAVDKYIVLEDIKIVTDIGTDDIDAYVEAEDYGSIQDLFETIQTDAFYYLNVYPSFFDFKDAPTIHKYEDGKLIMDVKSYSPKRKEGILGSIPPERYHIDKVNKAFKPYKEYHSCTITKDS